MRSLLVFLQFESYRWFGTWLRGTVSSPFLIALAKRRVLFVMVNKSRQLLMYFCESLSKITGRGMGVFMFL